MNFVYRGHIKKILPMNTPTITIFDPELINAVQKARHIVMFTGAGVSAESGIPTFRDALTGLWSNFNPRQIATAEAFIQDKALVWGWYEWRRLKVLQSQPNPSHHAIAELARQVPKLTVVTQNVDDLHERAGSTNVIHLHGSLHAPRCFICGLGHDQTPDTLLEIDSGSCIEPPHCVHCNGFVRPGVVWFGENLPALEMQRALEAACDCDVMLVIGTSGVVLPAARIPLVAQESGAKVVLINPNIELSDVEFDWTLTGNAGQIMPNLLMKLAIMS